MTSATPPPAVYHLYLSPSYVDPHLPVAAMSISDSSASVLLFSLPPILIRVLTIAIALVTLIEISSLVALTIVIYIVDVVCSHLSAEGCVRARTVSEAITFGL